MFQGEETLSEPDPLFDNPTFLKVSSTGADLFDTIKPLFNWGWVPFIILFASYTANPRPQLVDFFIPPLALAEQVAEQTPGAL